MIGFCFYRFLSLASKIALTSSANSSKLVPKEATKPITIVDKQKMGHQE